MTKRKLFAGAALLLAPLTLAAAPADVVWNVDVSHSGVSFSVRHFFTPVKGQFEQFEVTMTYDPEAPEASSVQVRIPVASIDTRNERRDNHLRSPDFFEAETYPHITFESQRVRKVSDTELVATGTLTIKDKTHTIDLPVTVLGIMDLPAQMQRPNGPTKVAGFEAKLTLDRRDFGVGVGNWAATAVVGSDVEITIAIEANR